MKKIEVRQELHADVIGKFDERLEKAKTNKELKQLSNEEMKTVMKSIGFYHPEKEYFKACDSEGKSWTGAEIKEKLVWNVNTNNEGIFTTPNQETAEILSLLYQIDFRLKRIEGRINKMITQDKLSSVILKAKDKQIMGLKDGIKLFKTKSIGGKKK